MIREGREREDRTKTQTHEDISIEIGIKKQLKRRMPQIHIHEGMKTGILELLSCSVIPMKGLQMRCRPNHK